MKKSKWQWATCEWAVLGLVAVAGCHNYQDKALETVRHHPSIAECLTDASRRNPNIGGEIELALQVDPSGTVRKTAFRQNDTKDPAVEECIRQKASTWTLPATGGKQEVVFYKFRVR